MSKEIGAIKKCALCGESKARSEFLYIAARKVLHAYCNECRLDRQRVTGAAWRRANRDRIREYGRRYYDTHIAACQDRANAYYERNREQVLARARARRGMAR